ncbi:MAG: type I-C CRISPR-associated protein Cas8c/Csd1 [Treponema sp.]|jgi:CRISPR-associated protein Csd1|nr:type I-C CRISPR-associated protein Cas8c/Csd1 [Treponema sp.]
MGWLSELKNVYDRIIENDKIDIKPLPLYHITNNAPLEITLNGKGVFKSARLLGKAERDDWQTCMPCTEKSAARTSGVEAYPLCDKLEYVAGDYIDYAEGKNIKEKHKAYFSLLEGWAQSEYSNQKILSVYKYIKKGTLVNDILSKKTIPEMDASEKIGAKENNVFIRWNVEIPEDDMPSQTWKDTEIQQLWIEFYSNNYLLNKNFCYITGENEPIAVLHPAKIRHAGDSAKLISSNDNSNYTFRGRFTDVTQACQIGMTVSIKAHNALRWLIERQGAVIGNGLTVVAWCSAPEVQPQLLKSTCSSWLTEEDDEQDEYFATEKTGEAIKNRLSGYYGKIKKNDKILIMVLNAATPGRMSILLYREFTKSDFFKAQEHWHINLAWFYTYWNKEEKKFFRTVSAPSPDEIVKAAYGSHVSDNAKTMAIQRLLSCIIDSTEIPKDIEQLCSNRASRLNTLDSSEREKTLETACAVIKYNLYTRKENKKEYTVGLEEERKDRDYLYGRLLAVADRVESRILYQRKEKRDTNAVRYMQRFARYPCSTWEFLYVDKLRPYFSQHKKKSRDWYESLIQEIKSLFDHDEFVSEKALTGEFLLGYHCQQKAFWDGIAQTKQQASKQPEPTDEEQEEN